MSNDEGEEVKPESPFHEPPESVQNDPVYREAFMRESAKYSFDQRRIAYEHQQNHEKDFQSASLDIIRDSASNAGKSLIILNGAAAIAVLTKVGAEPNLIKALLTYSWGAGTGALVFATTYLAQHFFRHYQNRRGATLQITAIVLFIIGFAAFIFGGYFTASALGATGSLPPKL